MLPQYLKHAALRLIPEPLLFEMKKRHYRSVLRDFAEKDEPDLAIVRKIVRPGDVVLDIGANIGVYTRFLSEYTGPSGAVHSFEPVPPTFKFLAAGVESLALKNVTLHRVALSDEAGSHTMVIPKYDGGGNNFYQARLSSAATASDSLTFTVETQRLDAAAKQIGRKISFIKIDVEGAELRMLHGATALLEADHPALLIEIAGDLAASGTSANGVLELLTRIGYSPFVCRDEELIPWQPGMSSVNYFFLTPTARSG